ncbi:hypothetical protein SAMN05880590_11564 [Rhizobium sp. RU35A]|uniref:hypothetical protein n=1 Tax=Rhizobium sp. RU35A TaxID=1907414 RepID=UPI00095753EA|nr:hypothetical protein [Rhizobium sp. RU35A]SIR25796.1 hypothetical protein SAMN05880590_11564 [Rhizobium sp. RU35A]
MNSNILTLAAAGIGILAGAGGTYLIMPEPEPVVRAPTDAEIAALIAANPSLIPEPPAPVLEIPTEEEALAAYRKAYARNPLRTGRGEADVTLALGECDENASGPGVSCVAAIKRNPNAAPLDRVIGFAKSASGEWVATNY